jgi:hypothetical protein
MVTATTRIRLEKQAYASNDEAWGDHLNEGVFDIVDEAVAGYVAKALVGDYTLDVQNYITDEARNATIKFTGTGSFTVTAPAVEKTYIIWNACTGDLTLKPSGGAGSIIRAGKKAVWFTDGTTGYTLDPTLDEIKTAAADVDIGGNKLLNVDPGTLPTDAATLANKTHEFAAPTASLDMNGQKIVDGAAATDATDFATLSNRVNQFAAPNGPLAMNSQKITGLPDGTATGEAVHYGQFAPILAEVQSDADAAAESALAAATSETNAAASAAKLTGTSTTSLAIGTGSKAFTTQAGKFFDAGARVLVTSDADPDARSMFGIVTAYSGTSLTVEVSVVVGSGTYADWTIRVSGERGAQGEASSPALILSSRTSNTILGLSDSGKLIDITSGTFSQTFDAAATLGSGWWCYLRNSGTGSITLDPNSSETIDGSTTLVLNSGDVRLVQCDGSSFRTILIVGEQVLHVRDEKTSGSSPASPVATTWTARVLNTVVRNTIPGSSLASNTVTLPAGIYEATARAPAIAVNTHRARLQNTTAGTTIDVSGCAATYSTDLVLTDAVIRTTFTLSASTNLQLQYYIASATGSAALGDRSTISSTPEIYADLFIRKIN